MQVLHLSRGSADLFFKVLENAINKTNNRTADLRKDVASVEKSVDAATAALAKAVAKVEAAVALLETATDDETRAGAKSKLEWATSAQKKAKDEESSSQESLEVKEALLLRALHEQEVSVSRLKSSK